MSDVPQTTLAGLPPAALRAVHVDALVAEIERLRAFVVEVSGCQDSIGRAASRILAGMSFAEAMSDEADEAYRRARVVHA